MKLSKKAGAFLVSATLMGCGPKETPEITPFPITEGSTSSETDTTNDSISEVVCPSPEPVIEISCEVQMRGLEALSDHPNLSAAIIDCTCNNSCEALAVYPDNPCEQVAVYTDNDQDRYASDLTSPLFVCRNEVPRGYTRLSRLESSWKVDCDDSNRDIHPGELSNLGFPEDRNTNCDPEYDSIHALSSSIDLSILSNLPPISLNRTYSHANETHLNWAQSAYNIMLRVGRRLRTAGTENIIDGESFTLYDFSDSLASATDYTSFNHEMLEQVMGSTTEAQRVEIFHTVIEPIIINRLSQDPNFEAQNTVELLDDLIQYSSSLNISTEIAWLGEADISPWRHSHYLQEDATAFIYFSPGTDLSTVTYDNREEFRTEEAWVFRQIYHGRISQENMWRELVHIRNAYITEINYPIDLIPEHPTQAIQPTINNSPDPRSTPSVQPEPVTTQPAQPTPQQPIQPTQRAQ